MRLNPITLGAGLTLLIAASVAAQESPTAPSEAADAPVAGEPQASSFAEAFSEPVAQPSEASEVPPVPEAVPSEAAEAQSDATKPPGEPAPALPETPVATQESDAAAPVAEAVVPKKGEPPTREFMAGVWAEEGKNCATALDFKPDGTLIGPFPRWTLEGGVLTMAGSRQKIMLTVLDKNTMQSRRSETDPPRKLKRC